MGSNEVRLAVVEPTDMTGGGVAGESPDQGTGEPLQVFQMQDFGPRGRPDVRRRPTGEPAAGVMPPDIGRAAIPLSDGAFPVRAA